jgi:hypothetical protein
MSWPKALCVLAVTSSALTLNPACAQGAPYTPTATVSKTFSQYPKSSTVALGSGLVDVTNLYWLYETRGTYGGQRVDSWLFFFDPNGSSAVSGTVSFAENVLQVFSTQATLQATSAFQNTEYTYNYVNAVGLESNDTVSFGGQTVNLSWNASDPGDYIRVMTAVPVPEPATYAQLAGGLALMGAIARRRRRAKAQAQG